MRMIFPQMLNEFTDIWEGIKINSIYLMNGIKNITVL